MNRSILIVICDFLLVSLLAFSTVDINKVADARAQRAVQVTMATNPPESGKDLTAVMRAALEDERKRRDLLMNELSRARNATSERDKLTANLQQELSSKEQQSRRWQERYELAQTNIQALNQRLESTSVESVISQEKLAAMESERAKLQQQAESLQRQVSQLAQSNETVLTEKQRLASQLQVAEVEKRAATEQATRMTEQVKVERAERAKLAESVKTLASKSGELTQEIRENRTLAPNTIFNDFLTNRVEAQLSASRPGLFSETNKRKTSETVLVTDGTSTFALCHVDDTPLTLWIPGTDWEKLSGTLIHHSAQVPVRSLSFHAQDPRVVLIPVSSMETQLLGSKVYKLSGDPYKFQDAILVGTTEGYYGECRFEIDVTTPGYVRLDRNLLKGLFGKFNPSRGDLVFSKTGELLGIMANSSYCLMLKNFDVDTTFLFGQDVRGQRTGMILAQYYTRVSQMPSKLQ